jgi:hypothetical protein
MKSVILAVPLLFVASFAFAGKDIVITTTETNPALFLGLSWTFAPGASSEGGSSGVTLKILSTNERNAGALTAGVTYNFDSTIGCDLGVAYNGSASESLTLSYDLCKRAPQISAGASNEPKTTTTVVPPPT